MLAHVAKNPWAPLRHGSVLGCILPLHAQDMTAMAQLLSAWGPSGPSGLGHTGSMGKAATGFGPFADAGDQQVPVFLGYSVAAGARMAAANFIEGSRLPLILDLDETLLCAYTSKKLGSELERLQQERMEALATGRARYLPRL